jgi:ABC-type cobalamin/Fe3+-siderophores transport system ATPase subunit
MADNSLTALDGVSLRLLTGTFTAIMGPSGSGKSTLLQCDAGLDRPTEGTVSIAGQPTRGRRRIGRRPRSCPRTHARRSATFRGTAPQAGVAGQSARRPDDDLAVFVGDLGIAFEQQEDLVLTEVLAIGRCSSG